MIIAKTEYFLCDDSKERDGPVWLKKKKFLLCQQLREDKDGSVWYVLTSISGIWSSLALRRMSRSLPPMSRTSRSMAVMPAA